METCNLFCDTAATRRVWPSQTRLYLYIRVLQERINKLTASNVARTPEEAPEHVNKKRKRQPDDISDARPAKDLSASKANEDFAVELSGSRQVRVNKFKGTLYVNIREWYDKDGALAPGKGISLQVPQWRTLTESLDSIASAIADEDTSYTCKLSDNRQVSVKLFKGKMQVGTRLYSCTPKPLCIQYTTLQMAWFLHWQFKS